MRILIVSQYFWPENFRINEVACALKARGHEVEVLTGKPNYPEGRFFTGYNAWTISKQFWQDIPIMRIPMLARGDNSAIRLVLNYLSFIVSGLLFAPWILRKENYDVIFVYAPSPIFQAIPASFLGWIKGLPVVLWVQDLWPQSAEATGYVKSHFLLKLLERFVQFTYLHTDLLLVQSKAFIEPVSKLAPNIPIAYYPNSVQKEFYSPQAIDTPHVESLQSGFTVLFAGNVGAAQAMQTIVAAAEKLQSYAEIKIVILGSGSKLDWVAEQIVEKKLTNLYLEGRFPVETMPILMRQASALLVTLTDQPIFELTVPNKIQAYLAVGKPVIACLNGEGARLVDEAKAGVAVRAEDGEGLANAIVSLYQMSELEREQMGTNGRAYFKQHFDEEMLTTVLIKHFEKLILS
ncbi:glycosyltransferase family 4 protein [Methylotenera sp. L2L1]|uniref:glycosyltransferase family 4 protein n=1 Tax=Methylotenera sp. L2L1 TaxID=1502770 RepID=UPI0005663F68|nr:glycosyltransferase family 4 protein [Methylotenera sp. L2L1]